MKKIISVLFFFYTCTAFSQVAISGQVIDSLNAPVAFAPIGLLSLPDSSLVKGSITDERGSYSITQLKPGNYIMKVSATGFLEKTVQHITIDSAAKQPLVINLQLSASQNVLTAVSVTAVRQVVKFENGNITVHVEDSPLAKGNTVYDLLLKLPGISIDGNKIMIQGKTGTIVMVDERPQELSDDQLINLLKSMNADLVATIEILKNPPVKYDASGTSGMINIRMKQVKLSGLTGTAFASYAQGFYEQVLPGFSLNYKTRKLVLYSGLSGNYGHNRTVERLNRQVSTDAATTTLNSGGTIKKEESALNYRAGLDWYLSDKDIIGLKADGGPGSTTSLTGSRDAVSGDDSLGFNNLDSHIRQPDVWNTNNIDLNYNHTIDTLGSAFSVVGDYTQLGEDLSSDNVNTYYDNNGLQTLPVNHYRSDNKSNSRIISGRADLVKIIDTLSSLEAGLKFSGSQTANDYLFERDLLNNGVFTNDTGISNNFHYTEITYAAYVNYNRTYKKLSMKLGARGELTSLDGRNDRNFSLHKQYFNVFPNFSFDYKKSDRHDFQLNLSRRIDRPAFAQLNPFKEYHDQYSLLQGNPFLLPDYTDRAELTYNFRNEFSTAIAYSYTENIMMDYTSQNDSTKVLFQSIKNMKYSTSLEYSLFYNKAIHDKWNLTLNGTFASMSYKGDINGVDFSRSGITYFGSLNNSVLLGKNTRLELNGSYWGPGVFGIITVKSRWMASLAVNMTLCKDKLDLTVGMDDIFHSFKVRSETDFDNQHWTYNQSSDTRRFRIALNYKFGKINIEERNVDSSNEEEKERFSH